MKRVVLAVALALTAFVTIGWRIGLLDMLDTDYCIDHPHRPKTTVSHDERLSFVPPGPECRFTTSGGETVVEGPGWMPAIVAAGSIGVALLVVRRTQAAT